MQQQTRNSNYEISSESSEWPEDQFKNILKSQLISLELLVKMWEENVVRIDAPPSYLQWTEKDASWRPS